MNRFKRFALASAVAGVCLIATALKSEAQVGIGLGVEPACPYGYYDYAPYECAPYGYYGPEWFTGGVFIGAGPWFHGLDDGFRVTSITISMFIAVLGGPHTEPRR